MRRSGSLPGYEDARLWTDPGEHSSPPRTSFEAQFDLSQMVANRASPIARETYDEETEEEDDLYGIFGTLSRETARRLARRAALSAGPEGRVVCLSCPAVFSCLKDVDSDGFEKKHCLVDFDPRMSRKWKANVFIAVPLERKGAEMEVWVPERLWYKFDVVVMDACAFEYRSNDSEGEQWFSLEGLLKASRVLLKRDAPYRAIAVAPKTSESKLMEEDFRPIEVLRDRSCSIGDVEIFYHLPGEVESMR